MVVKGKRHAGIAPCYKAGFRSGTRYTVIDVNGSLAAHGTHVDAWALITLFLGHFSCLLLAATVVNAHISDAILPEGYLSLRLP